MKQASTPASTGKIKELAEKFFGALKETFQHAKDALILKDAVKKHNIHLI